MLRVSRWSLLTTVFICILGIVFTIPNFLSNQGKSYLPEFLSNYAVNLGLDLRGGSYILLEVDTDTVIGERLDIVAYDLRRSLYKSKVKFNKITTTSKDVRFTLKNVEETQKVKNLIKNEVAQQTMVPTATLGTPDLDLNVETLEGGAFIISPTQEYINHRLSQVVSQSLEIVRRRIDETGTMEPEIQRQGVNRILVQLPGVEEPDRIKDLLGKTAQLSFKLVYDNVDAAEAVKTGRLPPDGELLYGEPDIQGMRQPYVIERRSVIVGKMLKDAQPRMQYGQWVVSFTLDRDGARRFADVTRKNVGRPFAIVLDDVVISAPRINEPILGGQGQISGNFTAQSVSDLSLLLRAGALPAPLNIIEERTVGPSLGADSIQAGKVAVLIAIVIVLFYMVLTYGVFGVFAACALLLNIILIVGTLSALPITLTLPGIAGIVLTIGMAVDANVLVFERIREELALGKTPRAAVDMGYQRALTSILDANITTLIAAIILYAFGTGPVQGFAVTLGVGIITSVFTAYSLTRLFVVYYMLNKRNKTLKL